VDSPFSTNWSSVSTRSLPEQEEETLDPAIHGAAVNDEATLGKPFDNVGIAQAVADIPPHS
jgi:hypothetical protein